MSSHLAPEKLMPVVWVGAGIWALGGILLRLESPRMRVLVVVGILKEDHEFLLRYWIQGRGTVKGKELGGEGREVSGRGVGFWVFRRSKGTGFWAGGWGSLRERRGVGGRERRGGGLV